MPYTVHSHQDRQRMLEVIGASGSADLFTVIPAALRRSTLDLPPGLSEQETRLRTDVLAGADRPAGPTSFLGGGCYRHFVPAAVRALVSRSEFATSYTPYQPEVSQGTLAHIFEFQTCMCEITGMDVSNASLYDGASALAEGAFMALRSTHREVVAVSAGVHPEARQVLGTYAGGPGFAVHELPLDPRSGATVVPGATGVPNEAAVPAEAAAVTTKGPAAVTGLPPGCGAVLVQQPNYLGVVEDLEPLAAAAHAVGALLVVSVNPGPLGLLEPPGVLGADIVVGDAQVFGCAPSFGGPSVGFLACRQELVRQIPGRLVSQTIDEDGRTCYVLTLQAREQHIRRAKATSNICSNQALSALAATIHLALLGPTGLRARAEICLQRTHYLQTRLCGLPGVQPLVDGPFFNEFALRLPLSAQEFRARLRARGVDPGVPLTRLWEGAAPAAPQPGSGGTPAVPGTGAARGAAAAGLAAMSDALLVAVTELNPPEALDAYVEAARQELAR